MALVVDIGVEGVVLRWEGEVGEWIVGGWAERVCRVESGGGAKGYRRVQGGVDTVEEEEEGTETWVRRVGVFERDLA